MDTSGQLASVTGKVWVVMVINKDYDEMLGGVATSEQLAEKKGKAIMEYDESIVDFYYQEEEVLETEEDL